MQRFCALLLTSAICFLSFGRTTQTGVIQEYNGKDKKTPLAGVELNISSANNAVSDKNGLFSLHFLRLKPGDRVNVRRIEKLGYEIFNKEAVEQWNINPNTPFVVVMCRSDRFKEIRDKYQKVSSHSYARQYKKEQAELERLKKEGKLREQDYQKRLSDLQENYDRQLDNLENYVDRFSRIDLSELSDTEAEILLLIGEGRVDEAIGMYEKQNYVDLYIQESARLKEIASGIAALSELEQEKKKSTDRLFSSVKNQIMALELAGGLENVKRIDEIYNRIIEVDSTNIPVLLKYGMFQMDYMGRYEQAMDNYMKVIALNPESSYLSDALNNVGNIYHHTKRYDDAIRYYKDALAVTARLNGEDAPGLAVIYSNLGSVFLYKNDIENSHYYLKKAGHIYDMYQGNAPGYKSYLGNMASWYESSGRHDESIRLFKQILENEKDGSAQQALALNNIGFAYFNKGNFEESAIWFEKALMKRLAIFGNVHPDIASTLNNLGTAYSRCGRFDLAVRYAEQEIETRQKLPSPDDEGLSFAYMRAGDAYNKTDNIAKATENFRKALDLRLRLFGENDIWVRQLKETINRYDNR